MTHEQAIQICDMIATSEIGLLNACTKMGVSSRSFYEWMQEDAENQKRYARARDEQADLLADQIISIADDSTHDTKIIKGKDGSDIEVENTEWTNRSKLRVEARKWTAAKLKPKKYGDKIDIEQSGEMVQRIVIEEKKREE